MKKILLILLLLTSGFICLTGCEKSETKKENNEIKEETTEKELSLTDVKVLKNYDLYKDNQGEFYTRILSEKSIKLEELKSEDIFKIAARKITEEDLTFYTYDGKKVDAMNKAYYYHIPVTKIEQYFKEVTGNKIEFNAKDFDNGYFMVQNETSPLQGQGVYVELDEKNKVYKMSAPGIGGSCGFDDCYIRDTKLVSAKEKGDKLYLTERQIIIKKKYTNMEYDGAEVYAYVGANKLIEKDIKDINYNFDVFFDKGAEITIVLKKDKNDNYYFVESIVK